MGRDELTQRVRALEAQVATLTTQLATARADLQVLQARTAPVEAPPARLVLESVTGPVVKAVAFSAGARRAVGRLAGRAHSGTRPAR
jgi:Tfp pilus assembly protein FimV